jgi:hypothetical protein
MTTLQKIIKEAKRLKKLHPNKFPKWTDYVKAASKTIKKTGSKKVADVNVTYRSAKDADYIVKRKRDGRFKGVVRVAGTKAKPKPKPATHTDKGSHNVKIKVVSGVGDKFWLDQLQRVKKQINYYEVLILEDKANSKRTTEKKLKTFYINQAKRHTSNLKVLKKQLTTIKSMIK